MTQYLRHLAARALGTLDAVKPRVPARFEAWSDAPPVDGPPAHGPVAAPRRLLAPSPTVVPPPARRQVVRDAAEPSPLRTIATAPTPAHASAERDSGLRPSDPTAPPRDRQPDPSPLIGQPWDTDARTIDPPTAIDSAPLEVALFDIPAPASRAAERSARAARPAAREETVVHVTIGRIEVRAPLSTPAPSPRARAAAPTRGLEDWLAGRSRS
jgi:hypothetical protein